MNIFLSIILTLKAPITTAANRKFWTSFLIFEKNKVWYFMRIVCQQTIPMKYHALFVNFEKAAKIFNCTCNLLQIIGGALWVHICFGCQENHLLETFLLRTHSICFWLRSKKDIVCTCKKNGFKSRQLDLSIFYALVKDFTLTVQISQTFPWYFFTMWLDWFALKIIYNYC